MCTMNIVAVQIKIFKKKKKKKKKKRLLRFHFEPCKTVNNNTNVYMHNVLFQCDNETLLCNDYETYSFSILHVQTILYYMICSRLFYRPPPHVRHFVLIYLRSTKCGCHSISDNLSCSFSMYEDCSINSWSILKTFK